MAARKQGSGPARGRKVTRRRRRERRPESPVDVLGQRVDRVQQGTLRRGFSESRDAMAALVVVRAIERASELASGTAAPASAGLRRALTQAREALDSFIRSQIEPPRPRRRKLARRPARKA